MHSEKTFLRIALVCAACLSTPMLYAQTLFIRGEVRNDSQEPLDFATLVIFKLPDTSVLKMGEIYDGQFTLQVPGRGPFLLRLNALGFRDTSIRIEKQAAGVDTIQLPGITLSQNALLLKTVTVTHSPPIFEQRPGGMVVNVLNKGIFEGESAIGILEKIPGISVGANGISLKGKGYTAVYLDGVRLEGAILGSVLNSLRASDILKIEIINNTSVKYDANAQGGIVEITTRRGRTPGLSVMLATYLSQRHYFNHVQWGQVTLNRSKWHTSLAIGHYDFKMFQTSDYQRKYFDDTGNNYLNLDQLVVQKKETEWYTANFRMRYYATPNHQFGASYYVNTYKGINTFNNDNRAVERSGAQTDIQTLVSASPDSYSHNAGVQYNYSSDSARHKLDVTYNLMAYNFNNPQGYSETVSTALQSNVFTRKSGAENAILLSTAQINYGFESRDKWFKLDAGAKLNHNTTDNNQDFSTFLNETWSADSARINHSRYSEQISAAFLQMKYTVKKFTFSSGLRAEHTIGKGYSVLKDQYFIDNRYLNFFPSARVEYTLNKTISLGMSYSRTIRRPSLQDLDPFLLYIDSLSYSQGNVALIPEKKHSVELSMSFQGMSGLSFEYGITDAPFDAYVRPYEIGSNVSVLTSKNYVRLKYYSAMLTAPVPISPRCTIATFAGLTHNSYIIGDGQPDVAGTMYFVGQWMEYKFKHPKMSVEANWNYNSSGVNGIFAFKPMYGLDLVFKKKFLDDKLNVILKLNDIFYTQVYRVSANLNNLAIKGLDRNDTRRLMLSVEYTFGTVVKPKEATINSEERKRIKDQ